MKEFAFICILSLTILLLEGQVPPFTSIHQEQQKYYNDHPEEVVDSGESILIQNSNDTCTLEKLVFGYHPYWMGTNYLSYRWNLLSDLCYFSYEVDPYTGHAITTHNWMTTPVVDTAQANGVRVHLCVTLFFGHAAFFGSPAAKQTLINSLVELVSSRGAAGVNLDLEAVPASQGAPMMSFIIDFCDQFHAALPGTVVSIALPAVDWGGIFDVDALREKIDLFMVMGYDYYWNGSGEAGPVSPLYAMTGEYSYSQARTLAYYESAGVPKEKMLLGVPYYARQWPVEGQYAPAGTTGYGEALTYAQVANNGSGNYSPENKLWEYNSFSTYYSFENAGSYYHCFTCAPWDLSKRYDQVNYRGYAGIGIWALGYDHGRSELWDMIAGKFSSCGDQRVMDTIFDTGGPAWPHYNNEDYTMSINVAEGRPVRLEFIGLDLEPGFDSLWIYDGEDTAAQLIGGYSGYLPPFVAGSTGSNLTLHFKSDGSTSFGGWHVAWMEGPLGADHSKFPANTTDIHIYPNPAKETLNCQLSGFHCESGCLVEIRNQGGQLVGQFEKPDGQDFFSISVSGYEPGVYYLLLKRYDQYLGNAKIVVD